MMIRKRYRILPPKKCVRYVAAISNKDHRKAVKSRYNKAVQNKIQQNLSNIKKPKQCNESFTASGS